MLFPYRYISHSMERMQEFIDYIFFEVWCKAHSLDFDIEIYNNNQDLKEIITSLHYSDLKSADFFLKGIQEIFNIFKTLSQSQIDQIELWYIANNDIEEICKNNPNFEPADYSCIDRISVDLVKSLKRFFPSLYSDAFLSLKAIRDKIGKIDDHYESFMLANGKIDKCPYCGLSDLKGIFNSKREAYDHFIPKGTYPFNSINFRNLAPMCNDCNSSYKLAKDPIKDSTGNRRKAFYTFRTEPYSLTISVNFNSSNIDDIEPNDIAIAFGPPELIQEINTWESLFSVIERYRAKCCQKNDGKYWYYQIVDECENYGLTPRQMFTGKMKEAQKNPYSDTNFLRKPFLEACDRLHLFD